MICPRPEMVLAVNIALRSASAAARDFLRCDEWKGCSHNK